MTILFHADFQNPGPSTLTGRPGPSPLDARTAWRKCSGGIGAKTEFSWRREANKHRVLDDVVREEGCDAESRTRGVEDVVICSESQS